MTWLLVGAAAVLGAAVTWVLTARREADRPDGLDRIEPTDEGDDSSAFGGTPTPPSAQIGPAEGWMRDAEDEDALLAHDEVDAEVAPTVNIPPVRAATPTGDVAGVGEPETVAAVDAESEATAPSPHGEPAEEPRARDRSAPD
jgi:hypothetical protein